MKVKSVLRRISTAAMLSTVAVALALPGSASAQIVSGWIGPAGPNGNGVYFLHQSSINNAPLVASSKIYTVTGTNVAPGDIGVRARLFKSGALCEAINYQYNFDPTPQLSLGTTATCGSGSYNSHGFVAVWNGTNSYTEYVTFPSNPLNYTAPAARSAPANIEVKSGTNARGQSFGSGETSDPKAQLPDLIAAIGTNGTVGYIRSAELGGPAANPAAVSALPTATVDGQKVYSSASKSVPLYSEDGVTQVGTFELK